MKRDPLFTGDFWQATAVAVIHGAAGAAVGALGSWGVDTLHSLPWQALASSAGFGGLTTLLSSIAASEPVRGKMSRRYKESE